MADESACGGLTVAYEGFLKVQFSVLISVYKAELAEHLDACLASLACQTIAAAEIVLVEDGPIPIELTDVIDRYRTILPIVSLPLKENVGLAQALNQGLAVCSYELVARMDTDDVCLPHRFQMQLAYMEAHPEVAVLGAMVEEYDAKLEKSKGIRKVPLTDAEVLEFAKRRSPVSHPSVMFRRSAVMAVGGYPPFRKAQDYALWSLMLTRGLIIRNLPDLVLKMRAGDDLLSRRGVDYLTQERLILAYQRRIGFISLYEYSLNIILRTVLRRSPIILKRLVYKIAR